MNPRRIAANLVFFALAFILMLYWAINNVVSVDRIDQPYELSADFSNAFGVLNHAEVTYLGVAYGQVSGVNRIPGGVRVNMQIRKGKLIPEGSTAHISRKSAIGEPYIDFTPPRGAQSASDAYKPGTRLPMSKTSVPLEFSELLRSASALVEAVPPEAVATLLREASIGLQGRSDSLRELTQSGDKLAASLAERTDALDRLATNNTRLTRVVTEHRQSLGQAVTDLRQLADTLDNAKGDVGVLLDRGSRLLGQTADIVAHQKGNLDCSLKVLQLVIERTSTPEQIAHLTALLRIGPTAFDQVWAAREIETTGPYPGVWVRVGFLVNPTHNPPVQYPTPKELPPVAQVQLCASPLFASGSYRPAAASPGAVAQLAATGGPAALVGGLLLTAAALVVLQVRRALP
ncbi:MAG: phospholipid/cholesterol/gamma-HCH transport system substrate-binding protein [Actinomycetota bacterium]|jgi:phospholipid/cholesterol/gamma-HCH transport system substrate-binding protein